MFVTVRLLNDDLGSSRSLGVSWVHSLSEIYGKEGMFLAMLSLCFVRFRREPD